MTRDVQDGRPYLQGLRNSLFDLLPDLDSGRMLDVGAAIGHFTKVMRKLSPDSSVTAFEPFPGNIPHFKANVGDDPRVTLVEKAVMDYDGTASFHVPKVVAKGEGHWSRFEGFSSVGSVLAPGDGRDSITVATCRIDSVIEERVIAMKIDVQGAEAAVLRGTSKLFAGPGVDVLYVEFSGEADVLKSLVEEGYAVFSSRYVVFTDKEPNSQAWEVERRLTLSTGKGAFVAWPKSPPPNPEEYCAFFKTGRRTHGPFITNLVCVHPRSLRAFERASDKAKARISASAQGSRKSA